MDLIKYIFRFIPPTIEVESNYCLEDDIEAKPFKDTQTFEFKMFVNHPHYDFRIAYVITDEDYALYPTEKRTWRQWVFLEENIDSEKKLWKALKRLRRFLEDNNYLENEYATKEGYSYDKFLK